MRNVFEWLGVGDACVQQELVLSHAVRWQVTGVQKAAAAAAASECVTAIIG